MYKPTIKVLEDLPNDRFWVQLPDSHEFLLKCLKTLIPYHDRDQKRGLGWVYEMRAWVYPAEYLNDALLVMADAAPDWRIEMVEVLDAPEESLDA